MAEVTIRGRSVSHLPDCLQIKGHQGLRATVATDTPAGCCHLPVATAVTAGGHIPSRTVLPDGYMNADQLAEAIGSSRRHIDHWTALGHLTSITGAAPGSGGQRAYDAHELSVAAWIKRLRDGGVELTTASRMARELLTTGATQIAGLHLTAAAP